MKTLLTALATLALLASSGIVTAESGKKKSGADWSPEIRQRFQAARTKALEDPAIQKLQEEAKGANDEFFHAMREKMSQIDPGLAEIVKKKHAMKGGQRTKGRGGKKSEPSEKKNRAGARSGGPDSKRNGLAALDETERKALQTAREKAQSDPAVQSALEKKQAAKTPQDREASGKEYRKAMHDAMIKADPSIEALLKKLAPQPGAQSPPRKGKNPQEMDSEKDGEMMQ